MIGAVFVCLRQTLVDRILNVGSTSRGGLRGVFRTSARDYYLWLFKLEVIKQRDYFHLFHTHTPTLCAREMDIDPQ